MDEKSGQYPTDAAKAKAVSYTHLFEGQMSANVVDKEIAEYLYRYEPANEYEAVSYTHLPPIM